jgi:2-polyprenyl-3-methyl-5-hydroxy-6-metoxy-1,4-benzoquinol methylase
MANAATRWLFRACIKAAGKAVGTQRLHRAVSNARQEELSLEFLERFGTNVLSGPFKNIILPKEYALDINKFFIPKLIGSYESNIYEAVRKAAERNPNTVINVGCAEGYYTVGLARLLPNAIVYAFDLDTNAQAICARAAKENGVAAA